MSRQPTVIYRHPTDGSKLLVPTGAGWVQFRRDSENSWHVRERYVGSTAALSPLPWSDQNIQRVICGVPPEV
jgi:hypothetical protein